MKILRVANIPNNRTGGMSRAMYGTGDIMREAGHEVSYLYSDQLPQFSFLRISILRRFFVALALPKTLRRTSKQQGRFDVIEVHEPLAAFACWSRQRSKNSTPIVVFSHGLEERSLEIDSAYRKEKGQSFSRKEEISSFINVVLSKYAVRHADHVLCCNSQDVTYLSQRGVNPEKITRHFNGVETDCLARGQIAANEREAEKRPRRAILFVGTWQERKGILDLVPALNTVLRAFPDATFTAAGCGANREEIVKDFDPEVCSRVTTLSHFEGNAALTKLYRDHDIFVLPSTFEGQPLVMIEAAAFGLALVTTDVCGMIDFIEPESNGMLVPVGDEKALTDALTRLCNDPELVRSLGAAAQVTAARQTWTNSALNILKAYEKSISSSKELNLR